MIIFKCRLSLFVKYCRKYCEKDIFWRWVQQGAFRIWIQSARVVFSKIWNRWSGLFKYPSVQLQISGWCMKYFLSIEFTKYVQINLIYMKKKSTTSNFRANVVKSVPWSLICSQIGGFGCHSNLRVFTFLSQISLWYKRISNKKQKRLILGEYLQWSIVLIHRLFDLFVRRF